VGLVAPPSLEHKRPTGVLAMQRSLPPKNPLVVDLEEGTDDGVVASVHLTGSNETSVPQCLWRLSSFSIFAILLSYDQSITCHFLHPVCLGEEELLRCSLMVKKKMSEERARGRSATKQRL
jgi:hypothetical protein